MSEYRFLKETKLFVKYERRIARMYENYRKDDIENHLNKIGFTPLDVMVTGATGAGKSSTLNSFFDKTVAKVGDGVDPETMELDCRLLA